MLALHVAVNGPGVREGDRPTGRRPPVSRASWTSVTAAAVWPGSVDTFACHTATSTPPTVWLPASASGMLCADAPGVDGVMTSERPAPVEATATDSRCPPASVTVRMTGPDPTAPAGIATAGTTAAAARLVATPARTLCRPVAVGVSRAGHRKT